MPVHDYTINDMLQKASDDTVQMVIPYVKLNRRTVR